MIRVGLVAGLLLLVACAPAGAATVTWTAAVADPSDESACARYQTCPNSLTVVDTKDERNDITVEFPAGEIVVRDARARLEAGSGCRSESDGSVHCPPAQIVSIDAAGRDDRVVTPLGLVTGGDGDDDLTSHRVDGGPGADTIHGTPNVDRISPGPGADVVETGDGDDEIVDDDPGPFEADRLDGGAGHDLISFQTRTAGVSVDLGPVQEGGSPGEQNVLAGFESVVGSDGDDELSGPIGTVPGVRVTIAGLEGRDRLVARGGAPGTFMNGGGGDDEIIGFDGVDEIDAGDGNDTVAAGGGDDTVVGREGADSVDGSGGDDKLLGSGGEDDIAGGEGADRLFGGPDEDSVDGGAGRDVVNGGKGGDRIRGGAGPDRALARDRTADDINCGPGRDRVRADRIESARGCERVRRPRRGRR